MFLSAKSTADRLSLYTTSTQPLTTEMAQKRGKEFTKASKEVHDALASFDPTAKSSKASRTSSSPQSIDAATAGRIDVVTNSVLQSPSQLTNSELVDLKAVLTEAGITTKEILAYIDKLKTNPEKSGETDKRLLKDFKEQHKAVQVIRIALAKHANSSPDVRAAALICALPNSLQMKFVDSQKDKFVRIFMNAQYGEKEAKYRFGFYRDLYGTKIAAPKLIDFLCKHPVAALYHPKEVMDLKNHFKDFEYKRSKPEPIEKIGQYSHRLTKVERHELKALYREFAKTHKDEKEQEALRSYLEELISYNTQPALLCKMAIQGWDHLETGFQTEAEPELNAAFDLKHQGKATFSDTVITHMVCDKALENNKEYQSIKAEVRTRVDTDPKFQAHKKEMLLRKEAKIRENALANFINIQLLTYFQTLKPDQELTKEDEDRSASIIDRIFKLMSLDATLAIRLIEEISTTAEAAITSAPRDGKTDFESTPLSQKIEDSVSHHESADFRSLVRQESKNPLTSELTLALLELKQARTDGSCRALVRVKESEDPKAQVLKEQAKMLRKENMAKEVARYLEIEGVPGKVSKVILQVLSQQGTKKDPTGEKAQKFVLDILKQIKAARNPAPGDLRGVLDFAKSQRDGEETRPLISTSKSKKDDPILFLNPTRSVDKPENIRCATYIPSRGGSGGGGHDFGGALGLFSVLG